MRLATILAPTCVVLDVGPGTKHEILARLAAPLASVRPQLDVRAILADLERREQECSTAIADGIAIPHARSNGSALVTAVFGRAPGGIDFESLDGRPTTLLVVLVTPATDPSLHTAWLAHVARVLSDPATRGDLLAARDTEEIFAILDRRESSLDETCRAGTPR